MLLRALNEHWIWKRRVRVFGHWLRAPTLDRLATLWMHKLWILGREESQILRRLLRPGMIAVEVGANQGIYTLLIADLVRPARVFAFEPQPFLFQQLVSNVEANNLENVVCHNLAVSSSSGPLTLQPGSMNWGDNRIIPASTPAASQISVNAVSLDEYFQHRKVDFLKIDIQGWEAEAFFGARRLLEKNIDLVIMFELWPYGLRKAGSPPNALLAFLRNLGFQLWQISKGRLANFAQKDLADRKAKYSYCNLIGTRNPLLLKDLVNCA
jgi:FkbM family methyltransferase